MAIYLNSTKRRQLSRLQARLKIAGREITEVGGDLEIFLRDNGFTRNDIHTTRLSTTDALLEVTTLNNLIERIL